MCESHTSAESSIFLADPAHFETNPVGCLMAEEVSGAVEATSQATVSPETTTFSQCTPGPSPKDSMG
jgi:hypothetical protein